MSYYETEDTRPDWKRWAVSGSYSSHAHNVMHGFNIVEGARGRGKPKRTWLTDIAEWTAWELQHVWERLRTSYKNSHQSAPTAGKGYKNYLWPVYTADFWSICRPTLWLTDDARQQPDASNDVAEAVGWSRTGSKFSKKWHRYLRGSHSAPSRWTLLTFYLAYRHHSVCQFPPAYI